MEANSTNIPEEELDTHVDQNEDGLFIVRILHRPTGTIKISDFKMLKEEAINQALDGIKELLQEKRKGLY